MEIPFLFIKTIILKCYIYSNTREDGLSFCNDVKGLFEPFVSYESRLFIDSPTSKLNTVLLCNGNIFHLFCSTFLYMSKYQEYITVY